MYDVMGRKVYLVVCKCLDIIFVLFFLKNIEEKYFDFKYCLFGFKGGKVLVVVLEVWFLIVFVILN